MFTLRPAGQSDYLMVRIRCWRRKSIVPSKENPAGVRDDAPIARRSPTRSSPVKGRLASFARLLGEHMKKEWVFIATPWFWRPDHAVIG
jgi:hypothetical protein